MTRSLPWELQTKENIENGVGRVECVSEMGDHLTKREREEAGKIHVTANRRETRAISHHAENLFVQNRCKCLLKPL